MTQMNNISFVEFFLDFMLLDLGYDHVVLLLPPIKLDYNLTSTFWHSNSGLRGRMRTYRTILEWSDHALLKMVRYVILQPLRPELDGQDVQ
jgi:hypothetical protein